MWCFVLTAHDEVQHSVDRLHASHLPINGMESVLSSEITEQSVDLLHRHAILVKDKHAEDTVYHGMLVLLGQEELWRLSFVQLQLNIDELQHLQL